MPDEIETLDLSNVPVPTIEDRSFDSRFIKQGMDYLRAIRDSSVDYIEAGERLSTSMTGAKDWSLWVDDAQEGIKIFTPTPYARRQTVGVTPLPIKYHDALIDGGHPEKAVELLNMHLHEGPSRRVRTVGGQYRAMVSPSYASVDNYDVFTTVANAMRSANLMRPESQKPVVFYRADLSDENMYIRIIDEGRPFDINGDIHYPLLTIRNSEVGAGAMAVEAGFFRGMCANLMLHGVIEMARHLGAKHSEGIWSPKTLKLEAATWNSKISDAVNLGIAQDELFDKMANQIREAKEIKLSNPVSTVERIAKAEKITKDEQDAIIAAMMGDRTLAHGDESTLYAVVNGMTQASKNMGIERGTEMTRLAGHIGRLMDVAV